MKFDYEKMANDLVDFFDVDLNVERNRDQLTLLRTRHRAILLGFRFDTIHLGKERKKALEALDDFEAALEEMQNIHPLLQRAISEFSGLPLKKNELGYGDVMFALKEFHFAVNHVLENIEDRKEEFFRVDIEKIAAIDLTVRYHQVFMGHFTEPVNKLPESVNDASELVTLFEQTFPIFQVEPTNIRGAYANWRKLLYFENEGGRIFALPNDEQAEYEMFANKIKREFRQTGKDAKRSLMDMVRKKKGK